MSNLSTDTSRRRAPALTALALPCVFILSLILCSTLTNDTQQSLSDIPAVEYDRRDVELYEGRKVSAGQVLVKLSRRLVLLDRNRILALARKIVGKRLSISEVGNDGTYLIAANDMTTASLMNLFRPKGLMSEHFMMENTIKYIEPNQVLRLDELPQDPFFNCQWGLDNKGLSSGRCSLVAKGLLLKTSNADIDAPEAWQRLESLESKVNRRIVVAVLDSGIKLNHEDFDGSLWSATEDFSFEVGGVKVSCKAGSHGFNAITKRCEDEELKDRTGHGTFVAGIIGAAHNNKGIRGVSPHVRIMSIKVADDQRNIFASTIKDAVEFIAQFNKRVEVSEQVRVINASFGHDCEKGSICSLPKADCQSETLKEAVELAQTSNLLFVASAGDNGVDTNCHPHYPSCFKFPNVISVASTTTDDTFIKEAGSNFGSESVHLGAPGIRICSFGIEDEHPYIFDSGTSFAAPFVSGAAALVLSKCELTPSELRGILIHSVVTRPKMFGKFVSNGRLNVDGALREAIALNKCSVN
jgi:Subtilase family